MENKSLGIIIAIVLVVGIGGLVYYQKQQSIAPPAPESPVTPEIGGTSLPPSGFTMMQVAQHNSKTSCWSLINGYIYDLTSWIPNHPGGEGAILSLCGIDGTARFDSKHGGDSRAKGVLAGFKIGTLTK